MSSFITACIAVVAIATVGALFLNSIQEPVGVAFATVSVRN
jgi:hypothetical protein